MQSSKAKRHREKAERAAKKVREQYQLQKKIESDKKQKQIVEKTKCWNEKVLPKWGKVCTSKQVQDLCSKGIPPSIREKVWPLLIGNSLQVNSKIYIFIIVTF